MYTERCPGVVLFYGGHVQVDEMQSRLSLLYQLQGRVAVSKLGSQLSSVHVSTSAHVLVDEGKLPSSGEHGRKGKTFPRSQVRKERSRERREAKMVDTKALLRGMRELEAQRDSQNKTNAAALKDILAGIKIHTPTNEETRKRLGMPPKDTLTRPEKEVARLKCERLPENSMYPSAGPRLGIFNVPSPGVKVAPPASPNLAQKDLEAKLASMRWLKPTNQFELNMTDVRYPREFPIDNETANIEEGVGFEDHILLNHLLEGFPTRGPVRHFMEMVVTGLSKNPHYTAQEKREYVEWYRDYFNQFSDEELQTLPSTTRKETH